MSRYRKKPVEVDAVKVVDVLAWLHGQAQSVETWVGDAHANGLIMASGNSLFVYSLEGRMTGRAEDWLIRGVAGELYPCKPDIFAATYEAAA